MKALELWGGHECTVNRVHQSHYDQTRRSGHEYRLSDLDLFAELGLKALRYPVLWERVAPDDPSRCDWSWTDQRLTHIRALNMRPIVGLLHHGSGPRYTNLLDGDFSRHFAAYARMAAERYPWVDDWTPINEPLTTARFTALYGHWYPHVQTESAFWTALLNQIDATRLAMREIRSINPHARLIQTEDLGRTYASAPVAHQAQFDNARRWMTWDLLCGRVVEGHELFSRLDRFGLKDRLLAIADDPCPPGIVGVNHYLTSDRFLDHRIEAYPPHRRGGNRFMAFADIEAVRVVLPAPGGLEGALEEAWSRYGLPLAVTESHNGCTREEQVRWLREAWEIAGRLRRRGVDLRGVTAWALLGSFDWDSLLTREAGHYEPGAFDVSGSEPRPTALAAEIRRLALRRGRGHPAAEGPGWWRRDIRLEFRPVLRTLETPEPRSEWRAGRGAGRPLLILGATGALGRAFARGCEHRGLTYRLMNRRELTLENETSIVKAIRSSAAWGVVNAAGWVRVDDAQANPEACRAANTIGAVSLARICAEQGLSNVFFSSDLVFDGQQGRPYVETDPPSPINVYGAAKAEAERAILALGLPSLIVRTAAFFSAHDPHNFASQMLRALYAGKIFEVASDVRVSPTYVPDLVDATLDLLIDGESGLRHLANRGVASWAEFAAELAGSVGLPDDLVRPRPASHFGWAAPRPPFTALGTQRGQILPGLDNAIGRYTALIRNADALGAEVGIEHLAFSAIAPT
ncbi:MAG: family 1 glycosylhydrolase [Deltaproteobacteria bacterium]|nr:family 1 glycosylhydrolase [Deltaproteobacteria bacterium]